MMKYKNDEEYRVVLKSIHPDFEAVSFYIDDSVKMKFRCLICGYEWDALPCDVLFEEYKCFVCFKKINKRTTPFEKFLQRLREVHKGLVEYVGGYKNMITDCYFRCVVCGYIWKSTPNEVINGKAGCLMCAREKQRLGRIIPLEVVIERIRIIFEDTIEYVEGYVDTRKKCKWRCKIDGNEWWATPNKLMSQKSGCPVCGIRRIKEKERTPLEILIEQVRIATNDTVEYVSGYVNARIKCRWRCKICGHEWFARPDNILHGKLCPKCSKESMERPVWEFLDKNRIKYKHDFRLVGCFWKNENYLLRADFYIETSKGVLVIETDGRQHFEASRCAEPLEIIQARDKRKDIYCKEHGYVLIRVTSSPIKEWGTEKHLTLNEVLNLIEKAFDGYGNIDLDVFKPYDFNRE